jgi:hypothetical protein
MIAQISLLDQVNDGGRSQRAREHARRVQEYKDSARRENRDARNRTEYEDWLRAHPRPPVPTLLRLVHRSRKRDVREKPLTQTDLYLDDARPDEVSYSRLMHTCFLCLNAKSHPVR